DLRFGHVREEIEGDVELPREQAAAPKLGAQTALLDQVLDEGVAIRDILEEGLAQGGLALLQAADEALGIGHDLHSPAECLRGRIEVETDPSYLARGQAEESHRRARAQPTHPLPESED